MHLQPKPGRSVPDPVRGDLLPAAGRNVELSVYWLRRIADGDVEAVSAAASAVSADAKNEGVE